MILLLLLLPILYTNIEGALISQSSINDCSWGDDSEPTTNSGEPCNKKFLITMALSGGQGNTESLHANIDKAHEKGNKDMSVLKKPFRIELRKSTVLASYRAHYIGSANAKPKETVIAKKSCRDNWFTKDKHLPCGRQYDKEGKAVWDSQGFCCRCDSLNKGYNMRGGQTCGLSFFEGKGSAHCMKMHELWYDVFSLDLPMMQYNITLDLLEFQGISVDETGAKHANWTQVSKLHLNPSQTLGRSSDGRVVAEVQGSLVGSQGFKDFSSKKLLIPSIRTWPNNSYPVQYTNGPSDWLLVDSQDVDLTGLQCNKIGVYYPGFRRQLGKCQILSGLCFRNQPLDLWMYDNWKRERNKTGSFMVYNHGKVHPSSHPNNHSFILKFIHEDLHNSFVTLKVDASDISFVKNVGSGRIVETYTTGFRALQGYGTLTVELVNTGEVTAEFSVSVMKCSRGLHMIPAKSVTLDPAEVKNVTFKLQSYSEEGGKMDCEVQLFDGDYTMIQTAMVDFEVGSTCYCFGPCGCTCNDQEVECPELAQPPTVYNPAPIAITLVLLVLESIGAHGFIGFFASVLLVLGFIKLSCGGVICCRKTKAQEHAERLIQKGVPPKSPLLVRCSGECRGAKAAKARYMRKVQRLKRAGKSPHRLDDWRNTSFECHCQDELTDIRFVHVVRAVCFFYYCFFLPFIAIGRRVMWGVFKDTEEKKAQAEKAVLFRAQKKGKLEKYGVVDLAAELKKFEEESEDKSASKSPNKMSDIGLSRQELLMNFEQGLRKSKGVPTKQKSVRVGKKGKEKGTKLGRKGKQLETVALGMTVGGYGRKEYEKSPRLPKRREQKRTSGPKYREPGGTKGQYGGRKEKKRVKERQKERTGTGGSGRKGMGRERHGDRVDDSKSQLSHCGSENMELSDLHASQSMLKDADHSDKQSVGSKCTHKSHSASASVSISAQSSEKSDEFLTAHSEQSSSHTSHTSPDGSVHSASHTGHSSSHGSGSTESLSGNELGSGGEGESCSEDDSHSEEEGSQSDDGSHSEEQSDEDSHSEEQSEDDSHSEEQSEDDSHSESSSSISNSEESSNESSDTSPTSQSGGSRSQ